MMDTPGGRLILVEAGVCWCTSLAARHQAEPFTPGGPGVSLLWPRPAYRSFQVLRATASGLFCVEKICPVIRLLIQRLPEQFDVICTRSPCSSTRSRYRASSSAGS